MDLNEYVTFQDYYPVNKGAFIGIITVTLGQKLTLRMRVIRSKAGHTFANLPTDRIDGPNNPEYIPMIKFLNDKFEKDLCEHVSNMAKDIVEKSYGTNGYIQQKEPEDEIPF